MSGKGEPGVRMLMDRPCRTFVGAVRHHAHFVEDEAARARLAWFCDVIRTRGMAAFLAREYPPGSDKALIVNEIGGTPCVVDGNAHLVALVLCDPYVTLARIVEAAGRAGIVRLWKEGWEAGSGQEAAYETYIPVDADTTRLSEAYEGTDWFKDPPQPTKVIPSTIPFDTPALSERDRGRTLAETAEALRPLLFA